MIVLAAIQLVGEGCVHLPSLQFVAGSSFFFSTAMRAMAHLVRWFTYLKYHMAVVIINLCRHNISIDHIVNSSIVLYKTTWRAIVFFPITTSLQGDGLRISRAAFLAAPGPTSSSQRNW